MKYFHSIELDIRAFAVIDWKKKKVVGTFINKNQEYEEIEILGNKYFTDCEYTGDLESDIDGDNGGNGNFFLREVGCDVKYKNGELDIIISVNLKSELETIKKIRAERKEM